MDDFHIETLDNVSFKMKSPFDFSFISGYGKVFKVFDDQDSGNICFGVKSSNGKRYFVKFAGAPTAEYNSDIAGAIERLKASVPIYKDLAYKSLINLVKTEEIGGGFAMIFDWVDAICAHKMYPEDNKKFRALPLETRVKIFEDILEFHSLVAEKDYTAVDFYDGSIMWDSANERTVLCDIDFYTKKPVYGSEFLWGCSRIASPEERIDRAIVDEVSNVYNMGATAFCLLVNDGEDNRAREDWPLSDKLYEVVRKATDTERSKRQQSIRQLIDEWIGAKQFPLDKRLPRGR